MNGHAADDTPGDERTGADAGAAVVWLDGRWCRPGEAWIAAADDGGFLRGEGVFETIRVEAGRARFLARHAARLRAGCRRLRLPPPPDDADLAEIVRGVIARSRARHGDGRLRLTRTAAHLLATCDPWATGGEARATAGATSGSTLWLAPWRLASNAPTAGIKTTSRAAWSLGFAAAREAGADDALFFNERDEVCETSRANVVAFLDGALVTPPENSGALPGIARAVLLERWRAHADGSCVSGDGMDGSGGGGSDGGSCGSGEAAGPPGPAPWPFVERTLRADDLRRAEALATTNALRGVEAVARVVAGGGETGGPVQVVAAYDATHPAMRRLLAAWRAACAHDRNA